MQLAGIGPCFCRPVPSNILLVEILPSTWDLSFEAKFMLYFSPSDCKPNIFFDFGWSDLVTSIWYVIAFIVF